MLENTNSVIDESIFWLSFIASNGFLYLVNYAINFKQAHFLPYISQFRSSQKLGLVASSNQDVFRYSVEWSLIILTSRLVDLSPWAFFFCGYYTIILVFNLYQYLFRYIYDSEPNFFSDSRLLKNGLAIVWHESKWKMGLAFLFLILLVTCFYLFLSKLFIFSISIEYDTYFYVVAAVWLLTLTRAIQVQGLYRDYPNDLFARYHFTLIEIRENIRRSLVIRQMVKKKFGDQYFTARKDIKLEFNNTPPNIHIFFIESYGSYYYLEESLRKHSSEKLSSFNDHIGSKGWSTISNFSKSPITGGQSWLTYSSMLCGLKMSDNTVFENYLHDEKFAKANSLLRILKKSGYTNYNLNPISPIKGINVPYEELRTFYCIDNWILKDSFDYEGDVYGFGACPPDQYAMNFTMDLIKQENLTPYSFFYLTKNSHSPFIPPELVNNWKDLNHEKGAHHIHKGFLKHPTNKDYSNAIDYQLDNLSRFIDDHGKSNDIFLIMGDHQPPMLSDPEKHGLETPVHIISKDKDFLNHFTEYGFKEHLMECKELIKHEAMYSAFLRSFIKRYGKPDSKLPDYEPDGIQL